MRKARCTYQHSFFKLAWKLRHNWIPTISNPGIHYLATSTISSTSLSALSLGLNFIPVPRLPQQLTLQSYLQQQWSDFRRRVNIQYFFSSQKQGNVFTADSKFRLPSTWEPQEEDFKTPPGYSATLSNYLQLVKHNLLTASSRIDMNHSRFLTLYQNPRWLIPSLRELHDNKNIIITEADKNMGIVLMDLTAYQAEGARQLNDPKTYLNITNISVGVFSKLYAMLRLILNNFGYLYQPQLYRQHTKRLSKLAEYLLQLESKHRSLDNISKCAAKFYLLMKMHKTPVVGRPIVSTINSCTYHASVYVDAKLKPLLTLIPSYIESSQQLIHQLEYQSFPEDCFICCADIESLYPNIPIDIGIIYVTKAIRRLSYSLPGANVPLRDDRTYVEFIIQLMTWVLRNNYFKFGNQWFLQLQGTAMGTPLAVPFACLFVAQIEYELFHPSNAIDALPTPLFYKRYIDDIFYIARTKLEAQQFFQRFDSVVSTIRCGALTIDSSSGIFLDVEVYKGSRFNSSHVLDFKTYQKEQNRYLYLAPNSFHRRDVFKSMIVSELNRYRLSCTDDNEFHRIRSLFYQRLVARGYHTEYLNAVFPTHSSREDLLLSLMHRYSNNTITTISKQSIPLLFKTLNTFETSQLNISRLTSITADTLSSLSTDSIATQQLLSTNPTTCYCNANTSYNIVGNARKTLHQNQSS